MERARKKEEGEEEKSRYFILFFWRAPRQETQIRIKGDRRREKRGRLSGRTEAKTERDSIRDPPIFISFCARILAGRVYSVSSSTVYSHT